MRRRLRISANAFDKNAHDCGIVPIGTYLVKPVLLYAYHVSQSKPEIIGWAVVRLVRDKRIALGLSMNAVAKRAGLSHTMISRVERELRHPTLEALLRITTAMNVELWPIMREAEKTQASQASPRERIPNS